MWKVYSYEVKGRKHELMDIPCQDKTAVLMDEDNMVNAVALADGAGSSRLSEKGAECVVAHVLPYVNMNFDKFYENLKKQSIKDELVTHLQDELKRIARENDCHIKDMASTLLFCVIKGSRFLAGHIGDGVIGLHRISGATILSVPANGEFANETVFVSDLDAKLHLRFYGGEIEDIDGFVLMSDGSANSLYEYRSARFSDAIENIFVMAGIMQSERFNELLVEAFDNMVRRRTTDDCSIALIASQIDDLSKLPLKKQLEIFDVTENDRAVKKRLKKYVQVINMAREGISYTQIGRALHIKKKYVRKYINYFSELGLI